MNDWIDLALYGDNWVGGVDLKTILLIMLLSFALGLLIGCVYMWTHEGISYSRTFVSTLAIVPIIVAMIMVAMMTVAASGSLLMGFGLLAIFGVVRFRNVLKDTRDTAFILWVITVGMTVGTMRFLTALLGTLGVGVAFLCLRFLSFGTRNRYDAVLNARMLGDDPGRRAVLKQVLARHASRVDLASERRVSNEGIDVTYRLLLRDPSRSNELQSELAGTEGFGNVSVYMHDDEAEI